MKRDRLIILDVGFEDPEFPERSFYCWHCVLMEGLIASFPQLTEQVDVVRVPWPRPRQAVVDLIGPDNQNLPVLILADDAPDGLETGEYHGRRFVGDLDAIMKVLSLRHGLPEPHP